MTTILDDIIKVKRKEIESLKENSSFRDFSIENKTYSFIENVSKEESLAVIAEFKRASPSKGDINKDLDPVLQAKSYEQQGASAISVLTDSVFFKGSFEDLRAIRKAVALPILCKDFIIDKIQIDLAKTSGANIILLIAAALAETELATLYHYAVELGLEVLIEVHDESDLVKTSSFKPNLIGINNRNLKTFEVDLKVTERLAPLIKDTGVYVISESGIFSNTDAIRVRDAGVKGVLVGEALMRSQTSLKELKVPLLRGIKG
jgi:indole-3-glycerol phosphate synthase